MLSLTCLTFKEPILAKQLTQYNNVSVTDISLIFCMDTISYTLTSIGLQFVPPTSNGKIYVKMQYAGLLILGLAMYFEGPAVFLPN